MQRPVVHLGHFWTSPILTKPRSIRRPYDQEFRQNLGDRLEIRDKWEAGDKRFVATAELVELIHRGGRPRDNRLIVQAAAEVTGKGGDGGVAPRFRYGKRLLTGSSGLARSMEGVEKNV